MSHDVYVAGQKIVALKCSCDIALHKERAVVEAARACFPLRTTDPETRQEWMSGEIATWAVADLASALRELDSLPAEVEGEA